jgi:hypothetical protein
MEAHTSEERILPDSTINDTGIRMFRLNIKAGCSLERLQKPILAVHL